MLHLSRLALRALDRRAGFVQLTHEQAIALVLAHIEPGPIRDKLARDMPADVVTTLARIVITGKATPEQCAEAFTRSYELSRSGVTPREQAAIMTKVGLRHVGALKPD